MNLMPNVEGSFDFDAGVDRSVLLIHLSKKLRTAQARNVRILPNRVTFQGGVFRAVAVWLWLVGGNLTLGIARFRRFLREAMDRTPV